MTQQPKLKGTHGGNRKFGGKTQTACPFHIDNDLLDYYNTLDNKNATLNRLIRQERDNQK
jgi:hypothetical protein